MVLIVRSKRARERLKKKTQEIIFELIEKDKEFRYALSGALGLREILEKIEENTEIIKGYATEFSKLREEVYAGFKRHDEELAKLREDMYAGFKKHDEEIAKLREEVYAGFKRHDEELAKLREDMYAGFKRHDEILMRHDEEIKKLREDMNEGFKKIWIEIGLFRKDFE
ncbi:MAG: hypothetical protein RMH75_07495, partial [Archaeoglobaceae archaeon]|nr:hypothetical protein [Archaeoglobaceae archaeon]